MSSLENMEVRFGQNLFQIKDLHSIFQFLNSENKKLNPIDQLFAAPISRENLKSLPFPGLL